MLTVPKRLDFSQVEIVYQTRLKSQSVEFNTKNKISLLKSRFKLF